MKELTDILRTLAELPADMDSAIATVVRVSGSAYRSPGARLLITGEGRMIGQVSGGCLERDVLRRAGGVIASRLPTLVRYETSEDGEPGSTYRMGCGGTIDVLIEPVNTESGRLLIESLKKSRSQRVLLATVISKRHPLLPLGYRVILDNSPVTRASGPCLEAGRSGVFSSESRQHGPEAHVTGARFIIEKGREVSAADRSLVAEVETAAGPLEVFFDLLKPPTSLLIFGAGNDAVPLVALGRLLGWSVTVVDLASSPTDAGRDWSPDRVVRCDVEQVAEQVSIGSESAVVVMTHNFNHDQKLLRWLASQPLGYLGVLGPRHRTDQLLGEMRIDSLRAPVGLDIGAETPEEVAMSIAAEITAAMRGRGGVPLSSRDGPIHLRGSAK